MPHVFTVLEKDHMEVKDLLAQIDQAAPGSHLLKELVDKLIIEESKHEAIEEAHFWPLVRDKVEGGPELTQNALDQESEGKEVLAQLDKLSETSPQFMELVSTFGKAALEHIAYEEEQVWPKLRSKITKPEQEQLGKQLADAKQSAPTRPHPNTPSSPGVQKVAGPVAAATDKVRDALSSRG
jgi:hemerythrin superfamily protein